jgi:hypothetical protein
MKEKDEIVVMEKEKAYFKEKSSRRWHDDELLAEELQEGEEKK